MLHGAYRQKRSQLPPSFDSITVSPIANSREGLNVFIVIRELEVMNQLR